MVRDIISINSRRKAKRACIFGIEYRCSFKISKNGGFMETYSSQLSAEERNCYRQIVNNIESFKSEWIFQNVSFILLANICCMDPCPQSERKAKILKFQVNNILLSNCS